jgi:hypothetical protein
MMHNVIVGEVPVWKKNHNMPRVSQKHNWWEKLHASKSN